MSDMSSSTGLQVQGLELHRPGFRIKASFQVEPGERLALVGRSGGGKTTVLRALAGLDPIQTGRVVLGQEELTHWAPEKRRFGYVFQDLALFPSLTVAENLEFGLRVRGYSKSECLKRLTPWVERFGLRGREHDSVGNLSGGERQRVALIRTWVTQPRVLLLDEPFSALDPVLRGEFRQALLDVLARNPIPVVWVTHDVADLEHFATRRLPLRESETGVLREF